MLNFLPDGLPDWQELALCKEADPEAWFPEKGGSARPAKRICSRCPVRPECLEWALTTGQVHGILGGKTERERRRILRKRVAEAARADGGAA